MNIELSPSMDIRERNDSLWVMFTFFDTRTRMPILLVDYLIPPLPQSRESSCVFVKILIELEIWERVVSTPFMLSTEMTIEIDLEIDFQILSEELPSSVVDNALTQEVIQELETIRYDSDCWKGDTSCAVCLDSFKQNDYLKTYRAITDFTFVVLISGSSYIQLARYVAMTYLPNSKRTKRRENKSITNSVNNTCGTNVPVFL